MSLAGLERRRTALPLLAATGSAWMVMGTGLAGLSSLRAVCCVPLTGLQHLSQFWDGSRIFPMMLSWAVMLVAMMTPLLFEPVRHIRDRSLSSRRFRSITLFLIAYFGTWMAAGFLLLSLVATIRIAILDPVVQATVVAAGAVGWQCSPMKQRCLNRLHLLPALAVFGREADLDALRFGRTHGLWCVSSCWALMTFSETCSVGSLFAMVFVTGWLLAEHVERPTRPKWQLPRLQRATKVVSSYVLGACRTKSFEILSDPFPFVNFADQASQLHP